MFIINNVQDRYILVKRADGFKAKSAHGLFDFCVGAIDGMFVLIQAPRSVVVDDIPTT